MLIIPALYLSRGRCVSHYKGESSQATVLSANPLQSAREFEKQGAKMIHLVDLDGRPSRSSAKQLSSRSSEASIGTTTDGGSSKNREIARQIAKNTSLEVQYAEGLSSLTEIEGLFSAGVKRVSLNQFSEQLLPEALKRFGADNILFTIRAQKNSVESRPGIEVVDYGKDLADMGVTQIIFRDTKAEGSFHPNFDEVDRLILGTPAHIYAFGGIGSVHDLEILQRTGAAGVIISRALFEKRLSLRECRETFS